MQRRHTLQRIEAQRLPVISHVEVDEILLSALRNLRQDTFYKTPVRVQKRQSVSAPQVLGDKCFHQGRLARAGLADDVHVSAPVASLDAEESSVTTIVSPANKRD